MRAIDEKLEKLSLETESVVSVVPWQGEVLQVHPKISLQAPEFVCFFDGPGGLGIQWVPGRGCLWRPGTWDLVWTEFRPHGCMGALPLWVEGC